MGAEWTCQLVVRHDEDSQIGKVAEFLGKAAYRNRVIISTKLPAQTGYTKRTVEPGASHLELL